MKILKKTLAVAILFLFCIPIVSSCGIKGPPKPPSAEAEQAKKKEKKIKKKKQRSTEEKK